MGTLFCVTFNNTFNSKITHVNCGLLPCNPNVDHVLQLVLAVQNNITNILAMITGDIELIQIKTFIKLC